MKNLYARIGGLFVLFVLFSTALYAQNVSPTPTDDFKMPATMPFTVGETAIYEANWSKIIKGITIASLAFEVNKNDDGNYLIEGKAKSKGTLTKLFGFSFSQNIVSTIDATRFRALKTVKIDVQKDRIRNSEAVFDYSNKKVTYVETDPKEPQKAPRTIASDISQATHDILSGIYVLRLLPLQVGETYNISLSDSGLTFDIPVKVMGRERQKSIYGNIWCFRLEPAVFGEGRIIEGEGSMIIWITDDPRRLPIRGQINSSIGRVEVKLKSLTNVKK